MVSYGCYTLRNYNPTLAISFPNLDGSDFYNRNCAVFLDQTKTQTDQVTTLLKSISSVRSVQDHLETTISSLNHNVEMEAYLANPKLEDYLET